MNKKSNGNNKPQTQSQNLFPALANALGGGLRGEVASNTIVLGTGAFVLAALARVLNQTRSRVSEYGGVSLDKHLNTTPTDPLITKDNPLISTGRDKYAIKKNASEDEQKGITYHLDEGWKWVKSILERATDKNTWDSDDIIRWAVPAAGIIAGTVGGYRLLDRTYDASDKEALNKKKSELEKLHKDIIIGRALHQRDALDDKARLALMNRANEAVQNISKDASEQDRKGYGKTDNPYIIPGFGLLLTVALGLSALGAYDYAADRNPRRLKEKAMKSGIKQYAQGNSMLRSIDQRLTDDPILRAKLQSIKKTKGASPVETPIEYTPVTI